MLTIVSEKRSIKFNNFKRLALGDVSLAPEIRELPAFLRQVEPEIDVEKSISNFIVWLKKYKTIKADLQLTLRGAIDDLRKKINFYITPRKIVFEDLSGTSSDEIGTDEDDEPLEAPEIEVSSALTDPSEESDEPETFQTGRTGNAGDDFLEHPDSVVVERPTLVRGKPEYHKFIFQVRDDLLSLFVVPPGITTEPKDNFRDNAEMKQSFGTILRKGGVWKKNDFENIVILK